LLDVGEAAVIGLALEEKATIVLIDGIRVANPA
jgi:predicted nucleic acid-binding protein